MKTFQQLEDELPNVLDPHDPSQTIQWLRDAFALATEAKTELPGYRGIAADIGRTFGEVANPNLSDEPPTQTPQDRHFADWLIVLGINALVLDQPGYEERYKRVMEFAKVYLGH